MGWGVGVFLRGALGHQTKFGFQGDRALLKSSPSNSFVCHWQPVVDIPKGLEEPKNIGEKMRPG